MPTLKFILFTRNTTSIRPFIVRLSCLSLMALFLVAIIEIMVLVLGAHGFFPNTGVAEWLLHIKTSSLRLLHGI